MRLSRRNGPFTALLSKGLSTALSNDVRAAAHRIRVALSAGGDFCQMPQGSSTRVLKCQRSSSARSVEAIALQGALHARGYAHEYETEIRRRTRPLTTLSARLDMTPLAARSRPWWRFW